jgi:hypothetical protein
MEATSSAIIAEIFLQYQEHNYIYKILLKHKIIGFRLGGAVLTIYNENLKDIHQPINSTTYDSSEIHSRKRYKEGTNFPLQH